MTTPNRKPLWLAAIAVVIGLVLIYVFAFQDGAEEGGKKGPGGPGGPRGPNPFAGPVPVNVVPSTYGDLSVMVKSIGTVTPLNTVVVQSRISGQLVKLNFTEGQYVNKGQILAEIDPAPFQVKLSQAEGQQQQNMAQLKNAETNLALYQQLFKEDAIAKQQLDTQAALVNQYRGATLADKAQVDDAKLQLSYTKVIAPISGRTGLRKVDAGNLINSADVEGLVTITQTSPINVMFTLPEMHLMTVRNAIRAGQTLRVEAWDRTEKLKLADGKLTNLDNQIDTATGTLRLKAEFDNKDDALFPNQFVNVRLEIETLKNTITIPSDAIQYGAKGPYVFAIKEGKAYVRMVELGPIDGTRIAVKSGLDIGDAVVIEGIDSLEDGKEVILPGQAAKPRGERPANRSER